MPGSWEWKKGVNVTYRYVWSAAELQAKTESDVWSAPMYSALDGVSDPRAMMESARSLPYLAQSVSKALYRYQVQKAPVRPLCHLSCSPANPASIRPLRLTTPQLWRRSLNSTRPRPVADTSRSCITPPKPCAAAYLPAPQSPRFGGGAPAVALTTRSGQELGYVGAALPPVLLARIIFADSCFPVY